MRVVLIKKENKDIDNLKDDEVFEITKITTAGPDAFRLRYRTSNYMKSFYTQKSDQMTSDDVMTWFRHLCQLLLLDDQPYALMQCDFLLMPPTLIAIAKLKDHQDEVDRALRFGLDFISDEPVEVTPKQLGLSSEKPMELETVKFTDFENFTVTRDVEDPEVIQHICADDDCEEDWWGEEELEEEEYEVRGHSSEARYHQIHYRTGDSSDSDSETVSDSSSTSISSDDETTSDEEYIPPTQPLTVNYRGVELQLNRRPIRVHIPESRRNLPQNQHLFFDRNGNPIQRHCMTTRSGLRC